MILRKVVSIAQMRTMEKATFEKQDLSPFDLMVFVGQRIYMEYKKRREHESYCILAGTGNNGGDALVFGEQAFHDGKKVQAYIVGDPKRQTSESLSMTKRYQEKQIPIHFVRSLEDWKKISSDLEEVELFVDGLFGIGLDREITGLYKEVIEDINDKNANLLSIDVPSGLHADTGKIMGVSIQQTTVYTVQAIKQGLLLEDAKDVIKDLVVVDAKMEEVEALAWYTSHFENPQKRRNNSHKYHYKNVLTIGGQPGVMGAITLAGYSALVAGAGLSTVATNASYYDLLISPYPELMYEQIKDVTSLKNLLIKKNGVLFGLGMRKIGDFENMVFDTLRKEEVPLVLDAAALSLLKDKKSMQNKRVIATPHYGEFAKLMDISVKTLKENIFHYVDLFVSTYSCELILKGPSTIYANKDKRLIINQGSPALAKAGSGDVLAGIVLTYLARDLPLEHAILLHMYAGTEAEKKGHTESLLASQLIKEIPSVYRYYEKER